MAQSRVPMRLPQPRPTGGQSFEQLLTRRRSVRRFADVPVSMEELSQLLWAAQGVTDDEEGLRTAPSAGALYPLELHVVTAEGTARYDPLTHALEQGLSGDVRAQLSASAKQQECVRRAPLVVVIAAVLARSAWKYDERAARYVHMEAGHVAQNLLLQAVALGLVAVPVGAFHDDAVQETLGLPASESPLYLIPVGRPVAE